MEKDEYPFRPKLGRIRSRGGARPKTYVNRVLHAVSTSGAWARPRSGFSGRWRGRGAEAARRQRLAHRFRPALRRVVIKTRVVKLRGGGVDATRLHIRYIQRDGVSHDGEPGCLYDATSDNADSQSFLERSQGDRHQFRFIVSPEDATEMTDLRPFVRDLMAQMEKDLGTRLDWVAVDHFNTEHPHSHIVLRGKDEIGDNLVIARDYIARGMRERAQELVTIELGPQTEREVREKLARQVDQERFTNLDRALVRDGEAGPVNMRIDPDRPFDRFKHAMKAGRLQRLREMGLAREIGPGLWDLSPRLEETLRQLGERGDIIKTMHKRLRETGRAHGVPEFAIFDPRDPRTKRIVGQIIDHGLHDELNDSHYLIIDGVDGRTHYTVIGPQEDVADLTRGAIVEIHPRLPEPKPADRTIAEIAERANGLYAPDIHRTHDLHASDEYVRAHVRRLEALRRAGLVRRFPDGSWEVPEGFLDKVTDFEGRQRYPGPIVLLSSLSLDQQVKAEGATWLDRQLVAQEPESLRDVRFGKAVREALAKRRERLVGEGLAEKRPDGSMRYRRQLLAYLTRRELQRVAAELEDVLGKTFVETRQRGRVEGIYRRPVLIASVKFALIEKSHEFTLVPWRAVLERNRDKAVAGIARGSTISCELTKKLGRSIG